MSARSKAGQDLEKISKVDRPFSRQIFWTGIADAPAGKHPNDIGKAHIAVTIQVGWTGHRHTGRITRIAARQPLVVVQDAVAIAVALTVATGGADERALETYR